jgi:hypothetical protein
MSRTGCVPRTAGSKIGIAARNLGRMATDEALWLAIEHWNDCMRRPADRGAPRRGAR